MAIRPAVRIQFGPVDRVEGRTIVLNPHNERIGLALAAALTRVRHPDWSEAAIATTSRTRWQKMTWQAKARLLQLLGTAEAGS
jgi:hypothetical protein